jgi:hypothetical protein
MRKLSTFAASALILVLGAGSAFAIPSGDRIGQPTNAIATSGYTALAPANADDATQYTPLSLTHRGR